LMIGASGQCGPIQCLKDKADGEGKFLR